MTNAMMLQMIAAGPPMRALAVIGVGEKEGEMVFALTPGMTKNDAARLLVEFERLVKHAHFPPPAINAPMPPVANSDRPGPQLVR